MSCLIQCHLFLWKTSCWKNIPWDQIWYNCEHCFLKKGYRCFCIQALLLRVGKICFSMTSTNQTSQRPQKINHNILSSWRHWSSSPYCTELKHGSWNNKTYVPCFRKCIILVRSLWKQLMSKWSVIFWGRGRISLQCILCPSSSRNLLYIPCVEQEYLPNFLGNSSIAI